MSLLSRLFGGGGAAKPSEAAIEHGGFRIFPEPIPEGRTFRIAARIECEVDGEIKVHKLIRADTIESQEDAVEASTNKAKQMIDQLGQSLFD